MKVKIHFTVNDIEDYFIIEAPTLSIIREMVIKELNIRRLIEEIRFEESVKENNIWSEEL